MYLFRESGTGDRLLLNPAHIAAILPRGKEGREGCRIVMAATGLFDASEGTKPIYLVDNQFDEIANALFSKKFSTYHGR